MLINGLLLALALYLLQEGRAQQTQPQVDYFVDFPTKLLPLAYVALGMLIANFSILLITSWRRLPKRRWPYVTTILAAVLLGVIVAELGAADVWTIINPNSGSSILNRQQ